MCKQKQQSTCIFNERIASVNIFCDKNLCYAYSGELSKLDSTTFVRIDSKFLAKSVGDNFGHIGYRFELLVTD